MLICWPRSPESSKARLRENLTSRLPGRAAAPQGRADPKVIPAQVEEGRRRRAEGIWSLLKRSMASFAAADLEGLVRIVKRKLKKIQYRPHLIDGYLAGPA